MSATGEYADLTRVILDEYYRDFQKRNPNLYVFSAHIHMDEATPHIHIDFVPYTTGSKRGLDTRVSLKQALAAQGFTGGTRSETEWNQWIQAEKEQLAAVMERHDIVWQHLGTQEKHLSVLEYEKKVLSTEIMEMDICKDEIRNEVSNLTFERNRAKETAEAAVARMNELAPKVDKVERVAAKYTDDPEDMLPEAGTLESAKSYREKKAKPLLEKLMILLMSLYRKCLDLQDQLRKSKQEIARQESQIESLQDSNMDYRVANEYLKDDANCFRTLCRRWGRDVAMREVDMAQRSLNEEVKAARQGKRSSSRDER